MDLCDEADTTNDGKISIEEYLTIAKNYGIKVFYHWLLPVLIFLFFFQLSSDDIGHVEDLANSNKELSKNDFIFHIKVLTVPFILTFPICYKERASDIFLASRKKTKYIKRTPSNENPREVAKLLTIKSDTGHHSQILQCLFQNSNMFKQFDSVDPECDHHWEEKVSKKLFKLSDYLFIWLLFFKIRKAWKIFDKNGDGKISKQEFRSWWSLMNHTFDRSIQNSFNWRILKIMLWLIVNCEKCVSTMILPSLHVEGGWPAKEDFPKNKSTLFFNALTRTGTERLASKNSKSKNNHF